jgi:hypothetical protein
VVKHHNRVDAEHGTLGSFHELMMQSFLLTIFDQLPHQIERVINVAAGIHRLALG